MATVNPTDIDFKQNVQAALEDATGVSVSEQDNFAGLTSGQDTVTTAGTAEQLNGGTSLSIPDGATLKIRALNGNSTNAYVGDSNVSASAGYELAAGQEVSLSVDDVSSVYVDVDTGGEGVSWVVEQ